MLKLSAIALLTALVLAGLGLGGTLYAGLVLAGAFLVLGVIGLLIHLRAG